jgi:hypothetical protein
MKEKDELKLSRTLGHMEGESEFVFPWGKGSISLKYINYSAGGSGCPDSLLILKVSIPILGRNVSVQAPILIEAEKAGTGAAIQDLDKFCERSTKGALEGGSSSFVEIPMLVVTPTPARKEVEKSRILKAKFKIREAKV